MKLAVIAGLVMLALMGLASVEAGSGSTSRQKQRADCGCLVTKVDPTSAPTPPPTTGGVSPTFDCPLIRGMKEIVDELIAENDDGADDFKVMVEELENELQDVDDDNKVLVSKKGDWKCLKAGRKLKKHFKKHPHMKKKLHYKQNIKGCSHEHWYLRDLEYVDISISEESSDSHIILDVDDDCPFYRAIRNASQASGDVTIEQECEDFILEITVVLKCGCGYTKEQEKAEIHKILKKKHPKLVTFFSDCDCEIEDAGPLQTFLDECHVHQQTATVKKVISGHDYTDCPLLGALHDLYLNTTIEITIRTTIKQMHDSIKGSFDGGEDVMSRLHNCSYIIYQFRLLAPWIVEIVFDEVLITLDGEEWGDIYELGYCSNMCSNSGSCQSAEDGEATPPPPPTTPSPTTTGPVCPDRSVVVQVQPSCNCSKIIDSIDVVRLTWLFPQQSSFSATWGGCKTAVYNNVLYPTMSSKINKLRDLFTSYHPVNSQYIDDLMNIVIYRTGPPFGNAWGKVKQFCDCGAA
jgi:hypothetical protein